jgi:hypothetical protein
VGGRGQQSGEGLLLSVLLVAPGHSPPPHPRRLVAASCRRLPPGIDCPIRE